MGLVERLRREVAELQLRQQLKDQPDAKREAEKFQKENIERERHAQREQQAENFRKESEVGDAVERLGFFLESTQVARFNFYSQSTEFVRRGFSRGPKSVVSLPISRRDPDSVFDTVEWDHKSDHSSYRKGGGYYSHDSNKYIAVESCPDGRIVFHAGWFGSTTLQLTKWRTQDKEQILDKALDKAFNHPGVNKSSLWHDIRFLS